MKLFAVADVHLGMKFSTYDEVKEELVDARFKALARCVDAAGEHGCDLFVIAGDLFDRQNIAPVDVQRAADILAKFEGRAILILPGNHDFFTGRENRPWSDLLRRLESRSIPVVLLSEPKAFSLEHFDLPVTVLPGPCTSKHSHESAVGWIAGSASDLPEKHLIVGVAHGSIEGMSLDREGNYYPMTANQLKNLGAHAWVVGHTHRSFPEIDVNKPWLFVPGTPEPDGFDCVHSGGAWVLEFDGREVSTYTRIETGTFCFSDVTRRIENLQDLTSVAESEGADSTLLRLTLEGALSRDEYAGLPSCLAGLRDVFFYFREEIAGLEQVINARTVDEEFTPGSFSSQLLTSLIEEGELQSAQIAYKLIRRLSG